MHISNLYWRDLSFDGFYFIPYSSARRFWYIATFAVFGTVCQLVCNFTASKILLSSLVLLLNISESRTTAVNNITVPGSDTSATLTKLHPSYTYQVRVRANNSVGIGEPSSSVIVDMMEEAPSGPPTNIEVRAIGSEALQITWMVRVFTTSYLFVKITKQ